MSYVRATSAADSDSAAGSKFLHRFRKRGAKLGAALGALAIGATLAGCSDYYHDRRDTLSLSAGDAHATNRVTMMVDPWPRTSASRDIAFNGERMQAAAERYRKGKVIPPVNAVTSSAAYQPAQINLVGPSSGGSGN